MGRTWATTAATLTLATVLAGVITWRYHEYRHYHELEVFFDRQSMILPPPSTGLQRSEPLPPPDSLPPETSLLSYLVEQRNLSAPAGAPFVGYGSIAVREHPNHWPARDHHPVWFMLAPRPGRVLPTITPSDPTQNGWLYHVEEPPYDVTNGLWSEGFLYVDETGRRLGYYNPFYPLRR